MKKIYIPLLSLIILSITSLRAQNKDTQPADKHFTRLEYVSAAAEYLKLTEQDKADSYVYKQLAESYYNMFNPAQASKWYAMATQSEQEAETYYRYAQMLKAQGKYDEANKQLEKFASKSPEDQRAINYRANPNYLTSLLKLQKQYDVKALDINSDKSDFGAVLNNNTLFFASARGQSKKNYGWNDEPYLDIYQATYNKDGSITNAVAVAELNSKWHDGPVTISQDGNTMYFASESFKENSFTKDKSNNIKLGQVNIFKATKLADVWSKITSVSFNSGSYSTSNPSLSRDGKVLYFSSNMSGGLGGNDIWMVKINLDGSLDKPVNLGNKINTEADESFPFISHDNKELYFASTGRSGFGGYDVYKHTIATAETVNMGKPINTEKDDFAFTFNPEKSVGFLSSNRTGVDNIYQAIPACGVEMLVVVTNLKTGELLTNAKVILFDSKKNSVAIETTNEKGEVSYSLECNENYAIQASKDGFESGSFTVAQSKGPSKHLDAPLEPIVVIITETEVILNPIYFEFDKSEITEQGAEELNKLVQVMQNNTDMVIMVKSHTDSEGIDSYNMNLSDKRAKSTVAYLNSKGIEAGRLDGKGYGESEPKVDCQKCTTEEHALNRRSEFMIVKK